MWCLSTDGKKKAELFYLFCANECSIIDDSSGLPLNFKKNSEKSISAITVTCDGIATLIKNLDPNKAHGHDMINVSCWSYAENLFVNCLI